MNNSYRMNQRAFFAEHGDINDFLDLGHAIVRHVNSRVCLEKREGGYTGNRLLGLSWTMSHVNVNYVGKSILQRENHLLLSMPAMRGSTEPSYSGKIWLRFEKDIVGSFGALFSGSMYHIGTGGYSTWEGPWQEYGNQLQKLEFGVPWELRRTLSAYSFGSQFYLSDFPVLDQAAIMRKLADEHMPTAIVFDWKEDDLDEGDRDYLEFLQSYKEKMNG